MDQQRAEELLRTIVPEIMFEVEIVDVALWQWGGLLVLVLVAGIFAWAVASIASIAIRRAARLTRGEVLARFEPLASGPMRLAVGVLLFSGAKYLLALPQAAVRLLSGLEMGLIVFAVAWAVFRLIDVFADVVEGRLRATQQTQVVSLLPPGRKTLKLVVLGIALIALLDNFGFDVTALVAGLGVGGIAIALAAQKSLENLFGAVMLYTDRPVRIGDFCRFGDRVGTVEEIGLRSTRVRTLDRTVVSIPNAEFTNLQLENFARRDKIWYHPAIGLRYETTPDQIRYILVEVRRLLYAHPKVNPDPARIRFTRFGAYSLDLEIFAYVNVTDFGEFLEVAEDLNLRVMDIVEAAGSSFAFPSQTTYLEQGEGLDRERARSAEQAVAEWRNDRALYLPRFPQGEIDELHNTLEYPPPGAPRADGA